MKDAREDDDHHCSFLHNKLAWSRRLLLTSVDSKNLKNNGRSLWNSVLLTLVLHLSPILGRRIQEVFLLEQKLNHRASSSVRIFSSMRLKCQHSAFFLTSKMNKQNKQNKQNAWPFAVQELVRTQSDYTICTLFVFSENTAARWYLDDNFFLILYRLCWTMWQELPPWVGDLIQEWEGYGPVPQFLLFCHGTENELIPTPVGG